VTLPTITAADLPRQAYAHGSSHDPVLTQPEKFRTVINCTYDPKPLAGGLWTAPVTSAVVGGMILSTAWSDYRRQNGLPLEDSAHFLEIAPLPEFKGLVIDGLKDAEAILETYRVKAEPAFLSDFWAVFDWERMAVDGYDGLYLTGYGQGATHMPPDRSLCMYGWDVASVLWIRPSYRVVPS
jgi:hypothetical protein